MIKTALLFALVPLLAQVSPQSDPTSYTSIGWILIALFALVGMANQGIDLWRKMFPADQPPAHERYATKQELATHKADHDKKLKDLEEALSEEISAMDEKLDETCDRIEKRFETWLEQMDGKLNTDHRELQHWKEGMERVVGRVEAKVESLETKGRK